MVGKKSGKALLREEGLQRTDNGLQLTSWPVVQMINQKNYYTEYLKRDDQSLAFRLQNEEGRNKMIKAARDKDRALAQGDEDEMDIDDAADEEEEEEALGSKVIVLHPGSQNLRIGLASDALPKTVPMVLARRWKQSKSEDSEPRPKRMKTGANAEDLFGRTFSEEYSALSSDLKVKMRANKRRVLPNSKELVVNYNKKTPPERISQHNDMDQVEWTEIGDNPPEVVVGSAALRIPEDSKPRYKCFWPLQQGTLNEKAYLTKRLLWEDVVTIIDETLKTQLGLVKKDLSQYSVVLIIPDLYERTYVTEWLQMLLHEFRFLRACFIQESLATTFGAGISTACIVDIGAQKTSICCVEEGMCVENSRLNLKYGGADVTELFIKMMLYDQFPYADINLLRRHDFLLAEELKIKHCVLSDEGISVQLYDFHLRVSGQDTMKYQFKVYDEVILAPMCLFNPNFFNNSEKLGGRRKLVDRSYDIYDGAPNDPWSSAQYAVCQRIAPTEVEQEPESKTNGVTATPSRQHLLSRLNEKAETPRSSVAGSPAPEAGTPLPEGASTPALVGASDAPAVANPVDEKIRLAEEQDRILPIMGLDEAILLSIAHGTREDERKMKDFLGGIMVIGGGGKIPSLYSYLEERLREMRPAYAKDIMIGLPPRELDPAVIAWKGGNVFGKLRSNDSWIGQLEYDRLGSRMLAYKCMWPW